MISHELRCIFVHIPKTAGTSVEDLIWGPDHDTRTADMLWMGGKDPHYSKWVRGFGGLQHMRAEQIVEIVGAATFKDYFSFAFVRNPWDRAVSQYLHAKRHEPVRKLYQLDETATFEQYLAGLIDGRRERHCQTFEQWRFLFDSSGDQLVDFVGRFENLGEDFATVATRLGCDPELPHTNVAGDRASSQSYYEQGTARGLVEDLYGEDIQRFGYRFPY